jgi:hypothetical protein
MPDTFTFEEARAPATFTFEEAAKPVEGSPSSIPGTPAQPTPPKDDASLTDKAVGAAEAAWSTVTGFTLGAVGSGIGGLAGIIEAIAKGEFGTPEGVATAGKRAAANAESMTYEPRGEKGKEYLDAANQVIRDSGVMGINPAIFVGMSPGEAVRQFRDMKAGKPPAKAAESTGAPRGEPVGEDFPIPKQPEPATAKTFTFEEAKEPAPAESPFPEEAGNLDDVLPRTFTFEEAAQPESFTFEEAAAPVNREAEMGDRIAAGGKLTPEEATEFPKLAELQKVKGVQAERASERVPTSDTTGATPEQVKTISDEELQATYGPGTLGANAFLDPEFIKKTVQDTAKSADELLTDVFGEPGEHRDLFTPIVKAEQQNVFRINRWTMKKEREIRELVPEEKDREAMTLAVWAGDTSKLTPAQLQAMELLKNHYGRFAEYAVEAKRLEHLKTNYFGPQIWDMNDPHTKAVFEWWEKIRKDRSADPGRKGDQMSVKPGVFADILREGGIDPKGFSPFMLERKIADPIEAMRLFKLKPKSTDAAVLFSTYGKSMGMAVERGKTISSLAKLRSEDGTMMEMEKDIAPKNYVKIDNDDLEGKRYHPDIAPAVRVLLETDNPSFVGGMAQFVSYMAKRLAVSYSGFHVGSMASAWLGTTPETLNPFAAINKGLKAFREGGVGDLVDKLVGEGMVVGVPLEDAMGRDRFQRIIFDKAARVLDKAFEGRAPEGHLPGDLPRAAKAFDEGVQHFTWDYGQTGFKIETAMRKYEMLMLQNAEKIANGTMTEKDVLRQAANFANKTYGGLNWDRMIEGFDRPVARRIISELTSQKGRRRTQTVLFAQDWLTSTVGSWTDALSPGEKKALQRQLARRYLATSAIVTLGIGNVLNYYFTGHSMFENKPDKKNPTTSDKLEAMMRVDMGDGRHININKHFMEVPHAAANFPKWALGKINPVVKEPAEQITNQKWLTMQPDWSPPITKKGDTPAQAAGKRALHAAGKFAPITSTQIHDQGWAALGGFAGFPVTGMTAEQKRKEREK